MIYGFKDKFPDIKIVFKTSNYFPGDYFMQKAVQSAWNGYRLGEIAKYVFDNEDYVKIVDVYPMSEPVFDGFKTVKGIHPGSGGGWKFILNEICQKTIDATVS